MPEGGELNVEPQEGSGVSSLRAEGGGISPEWLGRRVGTIKMEKTHPFPRPLLWEFTTIRLRLPKQVRCFFRFGLQACSAGALSEDCSRALRVFTFTRRALTLIFQVVSLSLRLHCAGARLPCFVLAQGPVLANGPLLIVPANRWCWGCHGSVRVAAVWGCCDRAGALQHAGGGLEVDQWSGNNAFLGKA